VGIPVLHANEAATDVALVQRLLAAQLPQWADRPVRPVAASGTDHALYRLGEDLVVRLPRLERSARQIAKERLWLPQLTPGLPLATPQPVAWGEPAEGFAFPWAIYRWVPGEPARRGRLDDPVRAARDLAAFILALQAVDPTGGPAPGAHNVWRGQPVAVRDRIFRETLAGLEDDIDTAAALAAWEDVLAADPWRGPPVWLHGDLMPGNLIVDAGRLTAVIDFGCLGVGDPACELMPAWNLFDGPARAAFRAALPYDDDTWRRGRGWALQGVMGIGYYRATKPDFAAQGVRTVTAAIEDWREGRSRA